MLLFLYAFCTHVWKIPVKRQPVTLTIKSARDRIAYRKLIIAKISQRNLRMINRSYY